MNLQLIHSRADFIELRPASKEELNEDGKGSYALSFHPEFVEGSSAFNIVFLATAKIEPSTCLVVKYISKFTTSDEITDDDKENSHFIHNNAPAIAFPFLRSFLSHLVMMAGYPPVVLPSINFAKLEAGETVGELLGE